MEYRCIAVGFFFIVATFQCLATSAHIKLHFYVLERLSRLFLPEADNRLGAEDSWCLYNRSEKFTCQFCERQDKKECL